MEQYEQITLDQWMQWKEDIRQKLTETAGNFVHIGYRLKQIRDSGMYDGAEDIFAFAEREYGLGKSTVSRFIAINEKYSEGGNSLELRAEFKNFSSSKLSEMLTLPDAECQLITEKTTIKEIRELKNFDRQQAEETSHPREEETQRTPLEKCIIDLFEGKKDELNIIMSHLRSEEPEYREAEEVLNPSGQGSHRKGIVFLFFYDWITGVKYKLMAQPEPVAMSWPEFLDTVYRIYAECDQEDIWTDFYRKKACSDGTAAAVQEDGPAESGQGFEDPVATSQQDMEENGEKEENDQKNEDDIQNGEECRKTVKKDTVMDAGDDETGVQENDGDGRRTAPEILGEEDVEVLKPDSGQQSGEQMDITQFAEYMPEPKIDHDAEAGYLDALRDILDNIYDQAEQRQYSFAEELLEAARGTLHKIMEVSETGGQHEEHNA